MNRRGTGKRLIIQRETLRTLTDKALEEAKGGGAYNTNDICSTDSQYKCFNGYTNPCRMRK